MNRTNKSLLVRAIWYLTGLALFYAPFALYERFMISVFEVDGRADIHRVCLRMGTSKLVWGNWSEMIFSTQMVIFVFILASFFIGSLFCGKFCFAGAFTEYLSRLIPEHYKVNWQKYINPIPIRYGMLVGFLAMPLLGLSVTCSYCNFAFMERMILGGNKMDISVMGSTTILTAFIWIVVFGAFAKGGRGFSSYLCPMGAIASLLHGIGSRVPYTYKLNFSHDACVSCGLCVNQCAMGALDITEKRIKYEMLNCISCLQCVNVCPTNAITNKFNEGSYKIKNYTKNKYNLAQDKT